VGAGLLAPLANGVWTDLEFPFLELGYLAIGFSGAIFLFDKIFGLSKGWIRFMTARQKIAHQAEVFQLGWIQMKQSESKPKTKFAFLLDYVKNLQKVVESETRQWATDFESSVRQLESLTRTPSKK